MYHIALRLAKSIKVNYIAFCIQKAINLHFRELRQFWHHVVLGIYGQDEPGYDQAQTTKENENSSNKKLVKCAAEDVEDASLLHARCRERAVPSMRPAPLRSGEHGVRFTGYTPWPCSIRRKDSHSSDSHSSDSREQMNSLIQEGRRASVSHSINTEPEGRATTTTGNGCPTRTDQPDPEHRTFEKTTMFACENTSAKLCPNKQKTNPEPKQSIAKQTWKSKQKPQSDTEELQKQDTKYKPDRGSNPAQANKLLVGTDKLGDCSGAMPKFGGKPHNPLFEDPTELSSNESIRKKRHPRKDAKMSQCSVSAIKHRNQEEEDATFVVIHHTVKPRGRREQPQTRPFIMGSETYRNEMGLMNMFPTNQQVCRPKVLAVDRKHSTNLDEVTIVTPPLKTLTTTGTPNTARTDSRPSNDYHRVATSRYHSSATKISSTDVAANQLTAINSLTTASSARDVHNNAASNGKTIAGERRTYTVDVINNTKRRTRGRKKQPTKHNDWNVEAAPLVEIVSASDIAHSKFGDILLNVLLKMQKVLGKHEQKMSTLRDAFGEQGATMHELEAQKSEFEVSSRQLLARLRTVSHDVTSNETVVQLRRRVGVECKRLETALPIYARRTDMAETVRGNAVCVLLGETGSGKSTQLTQYVYEAVAAPGGKIVCTQPRKVAAVSLATRVAHELATPLGGDLVGYNIGQQRRQSDDTALIYVTDHVLLNECLRDPLLSAYSCIIIDEAHERSIFTDLLLGMVKRCLDVRDNLHVIITSATIDPELFVRYFGGCPVLKVHGRTYPVDVHYEARNDQPSSGDYLDRAVQKVIQIHANEPPGDVLVFVPSVLDTDKGCEATRQLDDVVSLPLHGGLPPNEQQKVFDPEINGRRKIVFATNCAETSVTVPGIRYVVDTGLAKERSYNSELNVSSLKLGFISRSSAEQRKGRAGRTAPGTCYRLYSTECCDNMMPTSTPEILRIHLGQAILKLMDIGVEDPACFDYVESPPPVALTAAAVALESLGATTDGRINELGWRLSRLNMQPRLGKVIFLAIDAGVGYEGLVATALSTVGGYVFFRGVGESEQQTADRNKFRICEESGDVLTFVSLYKQWTAQPERTKNRWCVENSVNAKFMRLARDSVNEIKRTLKRDLDVDVKEEAEKKYAVDQLLEEIMLECYADNLGFFSGHQRTGYWVAIGGGGGKDGQTLHLHPSSALASLGAQPRWIIYENVMVTSRPYLMNVTAINDGLIERFIANGRLPGVDVAGLARQQLRACRLPPVGINIMRALTGRGFEHLKRLENETRRRCETEMLMLDASFSESRLVVYVMPHLEETATAVVAASIANEKDCLAAEWSEVALGDGGGGVRVVLGRGGAVTHLLMPDEYRTVVITEGSGNADILDTLHRIGPMVNYTRFKAKDRSRRWGEVTFDQPQHARRAVNDNSRVFSARPVCGSARSAANFTLFAKWCRRRPKGYAFVTMENPEDVNRVCDAKVLILGRLVDVSVSQEDDKQLYLTNLPLGVDDSDILTALRRMVDDNELSIHSVVIPRESVGATTRSELEHLKSNLSAAIKIHVRRGPYRVEMIPAKEKDFYYNARIIFTTAAVGITALRALNDHVTMGRKPVAFTPDLRTSLTVARPVFDTICEELEQVIQLCSRDGNFVNVSKKSPLDVRNVVVWIHSDSLPGLRMAADTVRRVIRTETVQFESTEEFRCVTGPAGLQELRRIEADTVAKIMVDARVMNVLVHGSETAQRRALMLVDRFVQDNKALLSKELLLRDFASRGKTVQLMKRLLAKYGVELEELQRHTGAHYLELQLRRHALMFRGTEGAYESLQKELREDDAQLTDGSTTKPTTDSPNCPLCFCPVDDLDTYRLEYCGHAYCRQCIGDLLKYKCRDAEFPVTCVQEGCGEPIVLRDLINLLGKSGDQSTRWHRATVESFVKVNRELVRYCVTPDCPIVYRAAARDEGVRFMCSECSVLLCTACHTQYHDGVTCATYKAMSRDDYDGIKSWLSKDSANHALCPSCAMPIEKDGGCHHMQCTGCHPHICWKCKAVFQSSGETYAHMIKHHGGHF